MRGFYVYLMYEEKCVAAWHSSCGPQPIIGDIHEHRGWRYRIVSRKLVTKNSNRDEVDLECQVAAEEIADLKPHPSDEI